MAQSWYFLPPASSSVEYEDRTASTPGPRHGDRAEGVADPDAVGVREDRGPQRERHDQRQRQQQRRDGQPRGVARAAWRWRRRRASRRRRPAPPRRPSRPSSGRRGRRTAAARDRRRPAASGGRTSDWSSDTICGRSPPGAAGKRTPADAGVRRPVRVIMHDGHFAELANLNARDRCARPPGDADHRHEGRAPAAPPRARVRRSGRGPPRVVTHRYARRYAGLVTMSSVVPAYAPTPPAGWPPRRRHGVGQPRCAVSCTGCPASTRSAWRRAPPASAPGRSRRPRRRTPSTSRSR